VSIQVKKSIKHEENILDIGKLRIESDSQCIEIIASGKK
jgi:hypothetical protein